MVDSPKAIQEEYLAARKAKDNEKAATFCHADVTLKTPKDSGSGIEEVKKIWVKNDNNDPPPWGELQENGDRPFREAELSFI